MYSGLRFGSPRQQYTLLSRVRTLDFRTPTLDSLAFRYSTVNNTDIYCILFEIFNSAQFITEPK